MSSAWLPYMAGGYLGYNTFPLLQKVLVDSPDFFNTGYRQPIGDIYNNCLSVENRGRSMQVAMLRRTLIGP